MTQLDPKMRVGLRIKELRAGLGLSQAAGFQRRFLGTHGPTLSSLQSECHGGL